MNTMEIIPYCAMHQNYPTMIAKLTSVPSRDLVIACFATSLTIWLIMLSPESVGRVGISPNPIHAAGTQKQTQPHTTSKSATPSVSRSENKRSVSRSKHHLPTADQSNNLIHQARATETVTQLPDFSSIRDVQEKKQRFFEFMLPMIRHSNDLINQERQELVELRDHLLTHGALNYNQRGRLDEIATKYRVADSTTGSADTEILNVLFSRVDVVPASLILAQSANESGWGTSRFAREANNLFGVWCFSRGCGLTPNRRDDGLTHEVAVYETLQDSVNAYIRTINTHRAYEDLREIRAGAREENARLTGLAMAEGLVRYSARGEAYVREIQQLIRVNNLHKFTLPISV